jgi:hypothetical protein
MINLGDLIKMRYKCRTKSRYANALMQPQHKFSDNSIDESRGNFRRIAGLFFSLPPDPFFLERAYLIIVTHYKSKRIY